jgi:serine/threonine protein kinase
MQAWQRVIHPSCDVFHEVDVAFDDVEFLGGGGWRVAWKSHNLFILKALQWDNQNFDALTFGQRNVDAIVSERLTSSQLVMDVRGFCGQRALNKFAQGSLAAKTPDRAHNPLTSFQKFRLSLDVAVGVENAHVSGDDDASIAHDDLKPDDAELLQWNQTSQSQRGFQRNPVEPWVRHRAPEQARKGELLALGSTLVHALTGQRPFAGESMNATKQKLKENIVPLLSSGHRNSDDPAVLAVVEAADERHEPALAKRSSAEEVFFRLITRFEELFGK